MKSRKAAVRYAKSLLVLARERDTLDAVQSDMETIRNTVAENRDLELLLKSPVIKADKKTQILHAVFASKVGELSMAFIDIMVRKGREHLLAPAAGEMVRMAKEAKSIYEASVTTAVPMDDATRAKVQVIVDQLCPQGATTELAEHIDTGLIGGFVIRYADQMVDASVASGIRNLKRDFSENLFVPEL